jgi:tight adherence protein B
MVHRDGAPVSDAGLLAAILVQSGLGVFAAVYFSWPEVRGALEAAWARYARWAAHGLANLFLPITPRQFLLRHLLMVALGAFIGHQLGSWVRAGIGATVGGLLPVFWLYQGLKERRKRLEEQLDAALQTLANNLAVTQNLVEGFAAVAAHMQPPISKEAELLVKDVKVGSRIEEALVRFGERCENQHVDIVVTALAIGLRTGGNLTQLLKTIAGVVREMIRLEGLVNAKTSEGKSSAWVMGALPWVFLLMVKMLAPDYIAPLLNGDPIGTAILVTAGIMSVAGMLIAFRVARVDI